MTEEVLIDFKVDFSELTTAQEQLAKSGKIDTSQFKAVSQSITKTATDAKGLISEFKRVATTATQLGKTVENAFSEGVKDALNEAGVSAEEFALALSKANAPTKTLKAELRELKEALALAKVNGKDTGDEFERMRVRAGALSDAIQDAGKEIKNAGSDTRNIDNVVGSISALAGGFAAVQGAAALFGDESEDVQKALLKVNGAMALASGIQQFYNATLKEGALTKLADSTATGVQTVATKLYTFVMGGATVATKIFRAALIATGIGAFVFLLVEAVQAMGLFSDKTNDVKKEVDILSESFEKAEKNLGEFLERLNFNNELAIQNLRKRGATEKEIHEQQLSNIKAEQNANFKLYDEQQTQINALRKLEAARVSEERAKQSESMNQGRIPKLKFEQKLLKENIEFEKNIAQLQASANLLKEAARKKLQEGQILDATFQAQAAEDSRKKEKDVRDNSARDARERRAAELNDQLAALQVQLLAVEKNGQKEVDIKKAIVTAKANIELNAEKLTANQIELIRKQKYKDELDLQIEFNKTAKDEQLRSQISFNEAALAGIAITNQARLQLQIENINTAAQLEINAAEGNSTKILLIEAKKISDIRALQNKAIDDQLAEQVASSARSNDIVKKGLTDLVQDVQQSVQLRIAASEGIERQELAGIQAAIDANDAKDQSNEDYYKRNKELLEQYEQAKQDNSDRIIDIDKTEKEKLKENAEAIAELSIDLLGRAADFASQLNQLAADQDRAEIDAKKRELQELEEAGAITQKNAEQRAKQIEILERQARQKQAQREKQIAVFNALLAIPQAYLAGLKVGGPSAPILAAVYAALAAAQAAIIIARPVPKFFRGKKGTYEGPGVVADMGAELVERKGRMFLYTKPTETYLSKTDKVYTASETRNIINSNYKTNKVITHSTKIDTTLPAPKQQKIERIDYSKMPKQSVNINIEKDFISEAVGEGLMKNKYFNNRYKF